MALRTPVLPFSVLERWSDGFGAADDPDDVSRYEHDRARARTRLRGWLDDPIVVEALTLASPSLLARATAEPDDPGIETTLVKYLVRMASRCTPFGLFAGTSTGTVGHDTKLVLRAGTQSRRSTRLDTEVVDRLIQSFVADPRLRSHLHFVRNSSLTEVGGTLHYAEARTDASGRRFFLVDVTPHAPMLRGLERARRRSTLDEIARAVAAEEIPFEAARAFVEQLVDAQLLVPTLGPVITGRGALESLLDTLRETDAPAERLGETCDRLHRLRSGLASLDADGIGVPPSRYEQLRAELRPLLDVDPARFVQVDLVRTVEHVEVDARVVDAILEAALSLVGLFGYGFSDRLDDFRRRFEERYEERTMPLAEVLDEEIGIGFETSPSPAADPSPLLAGLPFPPREEPERVMWGRRGRFLLDCVTRALAEGREEIVLDAAELARFAEDARAELPDAFHVMATILRGGGDDAPKAILDSAGGPSGARLIGRFCHVDPELEAAVRAHLRDEEALDPGVRYFEVVHLPEGRTGNILARPVLRDLELEYLGQSGAAESNRIGVDDLTVTVRHGRIVLRSRSLDCEVRPRITTAHDTRHRSLPLYRFLSALQSEGRVDGVLWTWGPLATSPRLPRVRLGDVVLARAQWHLPAEEIASLRATGHEGFRRVQRWRERRGLPRWVGLVQNDNVLTVDLDHPLLVDAFLDALGGLPEATVQEIFCGARPDAATGPEGSFTNEILIPFTRRVTGVPGRAEVRPLPPTDEDVFAPGSPWMTAKIYTGTSLCDAVLTEIVLPLVREMKERGVVDRWFFVRFGDPDWHLRVRWHGDPSGLDRELLPELHARLAPWIGDRRVHRLQLDTYRRETRRYGGVEAIEIVEELFHADSEMVVRLLNALEGDAGLDARWRWAAVGMDRLCRDAGLDLHARRALFDRLATGYAEEFAVDTALRKRLRERYREERAAIEASLASDDGEFLRERSRASRTAFERLRALDEAGRLTVPHEEILASLLHMHVNRLLRGAQRAHEVVLHRFLEKACSSLIARGRGGEHD